MGESADLFGWQDGGPGSPEVSAGFLSGLLGITDRRVQQLAAQGVLPKASRGRYPMAGCVRAYVQFLQNTKKDAYHATYNHSVQTVTCLITVLIPICRISQTLRSFLLRYRRLLAYARQTP